MLFAARRHIRRIGYYRSSRSLFLLESYKQAAARHPAMTKIIPPVKYPNDLYIKLRFYSDQPAHTLLKQTHIIIV